MTLPAVWCLRHLDLGRQIPEMCGDVGVRTGEQVIRDEKRDPVLDVRLPDADQLIRV
jgi:hypothetical protein